jgi:hypothetical protein
MTDTNNGDQQPTPERTAYFLCGNAQSNAAWLLKQYELSKYSGLALRAFHHLREAEKHLKAALVYHDDSAARLRYQSQFDDLRERINTAIATISEGSKITSARDIDERVNRSTILSLYHLALLNSSVRQAYRDVARRTQSSHEAVEQLLRRIARPYMDRKIDRENGLLLALHDIDVDTLADLDAYELRDKVPGISEEDAAALILCVRGLR